MSQAPDRDQDEIRNRNNQAIVDYYTEHKARDRERKARQRRADGVPIRAPNGYNIDRQGRAPRAQRRPRIEPTALGEAAASTTPATATPVREASPARRRPSATAAPRSAGRRGTTAMATHETIVISSDDDNGGDPLDSIDRPEPARSRSTEPRPSSRPPPRPPLGEIHTNVTSFDGVSVEYSRTTIRFTKTSDN